MYFRNHEDPPARRFFTRGRGTTILTELGLNTARKYTKVSIGNKLRECASLFLGLDDSSATFLQTRIRPVMEISNLAASNVWEQRYVKGFLGGQWRSPKEYIRFCDDNDATLSEITTIASKKKHLEGVTEALEESLA